MAELVFRVRCSALCFPPLISAVLLAIAQARQHNDSLQALKQELDDGSDQNMGESSEESKSKSISAVQREYAWCVVQVDRTNFQLRNALWGVALGM